MKRLATIAIAASLSLPALFAQTSDIVVFSEAGEKFTLVIDGEVKNAQPAARVVATGIKNATPLVNVNFADAGIPSIKENGWMEPGMEYTLRITTNKKGVRVLRLQGQAPLGTAAPMATEKPSPANFTDDAPAGTAPRTVVNATDAPVMQTSTSVTTTGGTLGQNVNVNMGVNGVNANMSVNDGMGGTSTTTITTTTTTSATPPVQGQPVPAATEEVVTPTVAGCGQPMSSSDFADAIASINDKGFDETKLTLAKQIGSSNCLSTAQVKQVMGLFGFEDSKLDFAKFAYDHVTDRNNYYKVNDVFGFSSSVDELNKYIQGR